MGDRLTEQTLPRSSRTEEVPERIVELGPFFMDRHEVTVRRFRAAMKNLTRPFAPNVLPTRSGSSPACAFALDDRFCTWRGVDALADDALDSQPLTCVPFEAAEAFCRWAGGDLPTEAQWEFAASRAFRGGKTPFPWGDEAPTCARATFGRFLAQLAECGGGNVCGPSSATAPTGDVTSGARIVGLGGNVSEWVRDLDVPFTAECWRAAPRLEPACLHDGDAKDHMFRGGSWALGSWCMNATVRTGRLQERPLLERGAVGFRCVRSATP